MNGSRFLLDTNIVAAYFNQDPAIRLRLTEVTFFVPSIVVGELFFGAFGSQRAANNLKQVRDFVALNEILDCDAVTAERYGQIRLQLQKKGRPLPENDIWIAATALQHSLILVSRDAHFKEIDGLPLAVW